MEVTKEGKLYYCEILSIPFKSYNLDEIYINLARYIRKKVFEYEGNEDLLVQVPVSIILDVERTPKNEWPRILLDIVNNFMDGALQVESNYGGNHFGILPIINYYYYKEGESFFNLKLPLTTYSDWARPREDIPSYDDFLHKICESKGISEGELSANLQNGKIKLSLEIHTDGRSTSK